MDNARLPCCGTCRYIERTSSTQVFLRCKWHCEHKDGKVNRCHVQPYATACEHYIERTHELYGSALMVARDLEAGMPIVQALRLHRHSRQQDRARHGEDDAQQGRCGAQEGRRGGASVRGLQPVPSEHQPDGRCGDVRLGGARAAPMPAEASQRAGHERCQRMRVLRADAATVQEGWGGVSLTMGGSMRPSGAHERGVADA